MSLLTNFRLNLQAVQSPPSGYDGGIAFNFDLRQTLNSGTSANQADLKGYATGSVSASSNADVDLRAVTDGQGNALSGLTEIVAIIISAASTNGNALRVKPSGSNGWAGFVGGTTDYIIIQPGASVCLFCPADGKYSVGASTKSINIANTDSGAAGTYTIHLVGRSA